LTKTEYNKTLKYPAHEAYCDTLIERDFRNNADAYVIGLGGNMEIKMVALDLDDTLLDSDLKISSACVDAIQRARQKGVIITLSTGRMFKSALPYARQLGIDVPIITYQGAWVKNSLSGEVLYYKPVPALLAQQVMTYFKEQGVHYHTYFNDELCIETTSAEADDYARLAGVKAHLHPDLIAALDDYDAMKIMAISPHEPQLLAMEKNLKERFAGQLYITRSKPFYLEVMNRLAGKAMALELIARHYGFERTEVMAIGDSFNDLDMIKWAGLGVAMDNAMEAVKEAADFVTFSNDEEGVTEALQRFVLQ
jgi:Cof subfamily protein (haloacid dehalogenase superfamily)